jgi:hypothetical protein
MGLFSSKSEPADAGPQPLAEYKVTYKGGLPELPKAKIGGITLQFWPDRFHFEPTTGSKKFWQPLTVPYAAVGDLEIVTRQVGNAETLLSAGSRGGTRNLATDNNIHITFVSPAGRQLVLRVEMLTGVTVGGQAKKCAEMLDFMQVNSIRSLFGGGTQGPSWGTAAPRDSAPTGVALEIERLAELHAQGHLSDAEFAAAKAQALGLR